MIQTGFESRIKVQDLIDHQLPEFILEESPNAVEFLKQYYISQEYQGGPIDISDNLDQYLKLDNLKPEVIVDSTITSASVTSSDTTISVSSTKGFPNQYGLLKIDDEIITYTGITTNSFTGCVRGFSGVTDYHQDLNRGELVFSTSTAAEHSNSSSVQNLSSLFLKDFYKKLKTDPSSLEILGDGEQRKSYLHIDDIISGLFCVMGNMLLRGGPSYEVYHIGNSEYCTIKQSAAWICKELDVVPVFKFTGGVRGWVGDSPFVFLDTKKLRSLGWAPEHSLESSIKATVKWLACNEWIFQKRR